MNEEEIFDKHVNLGEEINIDGDTFFLKPLEYIDMPKFWKLLKKTSKFYSAEKGGKDISEEELIKKFLDILDEETIELMLYLCNRTIEISYPKLDKTKREAFVKSNFVRLIGHIFKINSPREKTKVNNRLRQTKNESNR